MLSALFPGHLAAQEKSGPYAGKLPRIITYADDKPGYLNIPPPESYRKALKSEGQLRSEFNMIVLYPPDTAVNAVAEEAGRIWASLLYSDVPVNVKVEFRDMGNPDILGGTAPYGMHVVKNNGYLPPRRYPTALAEKLRGENLNSNLPDIEVEMNSTFNWYFGLEGPVPSGKHDFLTVLLHEIGHGLGWFGGFGVNNGNGYQVWTADPPVFDHYVKNVSGQQLLDTSIFPNNSTDLADELQSGRIYFRSNTVLRELSEIPELYAPDEWNDGSSIYHLDEIYDTKYSGRDALMTYSISAREVIHDPGPITTMMFYEMGWVHTRILHDSLKDRESLADPFTVEAVLMSDTSLIDTAINVLYSLDKGSVFNTINMTGTGNPHEFSAELPMDSTGLFVEYYITAVDTFGREYTLPAMAPERTFRFYIGADTISPRIEHDPVGSIPISQDSVRFQATVEDNLGVDTVKLEYKINGVEQQTMGLSHDSLENYSAYVVFSQGELSAGDIISYRFSARDASLGMNTAYMPDTGYYSFSALNFQDQYENDFELASDMNDFEITGTFGRDKPTGFSSWGLHTEHPYPSPEESEQEYDYYAQLITPIRVNEGNSIMTFDEIAFIEPGMDEYTWEDDNFFDFVIVEVRESGGQWQALIPGYDCRAQEEWADSWNQASMVGNYNQAVPAESMIRTRLIDFRDPLSPWQDGDILQIRFHIHADPFAFGWGWMIDNLKIQLTGLAVEDFPMIRQTARVYPNPSTGMLNVQLQIMVEVEELRVSVMDMMGRQILHETYGYPGQDFSHQFYLNELPAGVYLIQFTAGNQRIMKKIVLTR